VAPGIICQVLKGELGSPVVLIHIYWISPVPPVAGAVLDMGLGSKVGLLQPASFPLIAPPSIRLSQSCANEVFKEKQHNSRNSTLNEGALENEMVIPLVCKFLKLMVSSLNPINNVNRISRGQKSDEKQAFLSVVTCREG